MKKFALGLATGVSALAAVPASAAYVINVEQVGANVVATGSGSISLVGLSSPGTGTASGQIASEFNVQTIGSGRNNAYSTTALAGPRSFGTARYHTADSSTGSVVGINARYTANSPVDFILVPFGYVSNTDLGTSTSTYNNKTLADLGLTPGTSYTWTWGVGNNTDTFTINVLSAVPEPGTWALMILGFGLVGASLRRRSGPAVRFA